MVYQQGEQIENYRLDTLLERGPLADVFLGTHIQRQTQVMVKVFAGAMTREQQEQIAEQARLLARLDNPHILRLLDFGEQGRGNEQALFIVLEYAAHGTLRQRHPQGAPLPLDTIVFYMQQIADALQHAHDHGILHQSIKPEHIFVKAEDILQIDCSQRLIYTTNPGDLSGDVAYTPVEEPGPASDQYALATTVYEWLSGKLPFIGSEIEITTQRRNQRPPPLREHRSLLRPTIEVVVRRALEREAEKRYARIENFAAAFIRAANVHVKSAQGDDILQRTLAAHKAESSQVKTVGAISWSSDTSSLTSTGRYNPFGAGFGYHRHGVKALEFSPVEKRIAFSCGDNELYLCDIDEQGQMQCYHHECHVWDLVWSPDGQYLASISGDEERAQQIHIWEVATGTQLRSYERQEYGSILQWSPDGRLIASGGWDRTVHIWDPFSGETRLIYSEHPDSVAALAWSPDSALIVSGGGERGLHVWEVASGKLITIYYGHIDWVNDVAWSPDGVYIASAGDDNMIQIWNAKTRERLFTHRQWNGRIARVGWSPAGRHVVSGTSDGIVQECEVSTGKYNFSHHVQIIQKEEVIAAAWRTDLSLIAFGGGDRRVEVADLETGKAFLCRGFALPVELIEQRLLPAEVPFFTTTETITTDTTAITTTTKMQRSPEGPRVVSRSVRQARAVKVWGGQELSDMVIYDGHLGAVKAVAWSPDSTRIVSGSYDGTVQVWDAVTRTTIFTYRGHKDPVVVVAWSPDGQRLVSGSLDKMAIVWDIFTGQALQKYRGHRSMISSVGWAPDSRRVVSSSEDREIHVWDSMNGEMLYSTQPHTNAVTAVAWSPDGRYLAVGSEDRTVSIQEVETRQVIFVYRGHSGAVRVVAWSPDSKHIASGSDLRGDVETDDEQRPGREPIHIWSPTGEGEVNYCSNERLHTDVSALAWSPDGTMVAVTTITDRAEVYDAVTGENMAMIWNTGDRGKQQGRNLSVAWSPDGTRIAAGLNTGVVKIWRAGEKRTI
jgi:WD40 repeat protein